MFRNLCTILSSEVFCTLWDQLMKKNSCWRVLVDILVWFFQNFYIISCFTWMPFSSFCYLPSWFKMQNINNLSLSRLMFYPEATKSDWTSLRFFENLELILWTLKIQLWQSQRKVSGQSPKLNTKSFFSFKKFTFHQKFPWTRRFQFW